MAKRYIQRRDYQTRQLETVDEFDSFREAHKMIKEYRLSDPYGHHYISRRPCKDWDTTK